MTHPSYVYPTRIKDEWFSFACSGSYDGKGSLFGTKLESDEGSNGWYARVRSGGLGEVLPATGRISRFFAAPVLESTPLEVELRSGPAKGRVLRATRDGAGPIDVKLGPLEDMPELAWPPLSERESYCTEVSSTFGPADEDCMNLRAGVYPASGMSPRLAARSAPMSARVRGHRRDVTLPSALWSHVCRMHRRCEVPRMAGRARLLVSDAAVGLGSASPASKSASA